VQADDHAYSDLIQDKYTSQIEGPRAPTCSRQHAGLSVLQDAATPRSPQYFSTSFLSVSRWLLAISMMSLTPFTELQYAEVSVI
jgi:hypothetical protein